MKDRLYKSPQSSSKSVHSRGSDSTVTTSLARHSSSSSIVSTGRKGCGAFNRTYLLLDELGRGGYGFVYRCLHRQTRRVYAVKMNIDPKDIDDLKEEFAVISHICQPSGHANIVNVICSISDDRIAYNIYELATGGDLNSHLKRKGFYPEPLAVIISRQLFLGLDYIHSRGYLHRDIKPGNILIRNTSSSVHIKISDFGLSVQRRISSNSGPSNIYLPFSHGYAGTARYMSPEVFHEQSYDYQCDMWSCGVVLYQLLSGYMPFEKDLELTDKAQHQFAMPEWRGLDFAMDLIDKLFDRSGDRAQECGITANEALNHPFFNRPNFDQQTLEADRSSAMAHYLSICRLKKELATLKSIR